MGCVVSSRPRPLTPLIGKFSKSKVGPKKKFAPGGRVAESGAPFAESGVRSFKTKNELKL